MDHDVSTLSKNATTTPALRPSYFTSAPNIAAIVIITVAVLIIVVTLIVCLYRKRKLCFKNWRLHDLFSRNRNDKADELDLDSSPADTRRSSNNSTRNNPFRVSTQQRQSSAAIELASSGILPTWQQGTTIVYPDYLFKDQHFGPEHNPPQRTQLQNNVTTPTHHNTGDHFVNMPSPYNNNESLYVNYGHNRQNDSYSLTYPPRTTRRGSAGINAHNNAHNYDDSTINDHATAIQSNQAKLVHQQPKLQYSLYHADTLDDKTPPPPPPALPVTLPSNPSTKPPNPTSTPLTDPKTRKPSNRTRQVSFHHLPVYSTDKTDDSSPIQLQLDNNLKKALNPHTPPTNTYLPHNMSNLPTQNIPLTSHFYNNNNNNSLPNNNNTNTNNTLSNSQQLNTRKTPDLREISPIFPKFHLTSPHSDRNLPYSAIQTQHPNQQNQFQHVNPSNARPGSSSSRSAQKQLPLAQHPSKSALNQHFRDENMNSTGLMPNYPLQQYSSPHHSSPHPSTRSSHHIARYPLIQTLSLKIPPLVNAGQPTREQLCRGVFYMAESGQIATTQAAPHQPSQFYKSILLNPMVGEKPMNRYQSQRNRHPFLPSNRSFVPQIPHLPAQNSRQRRPNTSVTSNPLNPSNLPLKYPLHPSTSNPSLITALPFMPLIANTIELNKQDKMEQMSQTTFKSAYFPLLSTGLRFYGSVLLSPHGTSIQASIPQQQRPTFQALSHTFANRPLYTPALSLPLPTAISGLGSTDLSEFHTTALTTAPNQQHEATIGNNPVPFRRHRHFLFDALVQNKERIYTRNAEKVKANQRLLMELTKQETKLRQIRANIDALQSTNNLRSVSVEGGSGEPESDDIAGPVTSRTQNKEPMTAQISLSTKTNTQFSPRDELAPITPVELLENVVLLDNLDNPDYNISTISSNLAVIPTLPTRETLSPIDTVTEIPTKATSSSSLTPPTAHFGGKYRTAAAHITSIDEIAPSSEHALTASKHTSDKTELAPSGRVPSIGIKSYTGDDIIPLTSLTNSQFNHKNSNLLPLSDHVHFTRLKRAKPRKSALADLNRPQSEQIGENSPKVPQKHPQNSIGIPVKSLKPIDLDTVEVVDVVDATAPQNLPDQQHTLNQVSAPADILIPRNAKSLRSQYKSAYRVRKHQQKQIRRDQRKNRPKRPMQAIHLENVRKISNISNPIQSPTALEQEARKQDQQQEPMLPPQDQQQSSIQPNDDQITQRVAEITQPRDQMHKQPQLQPGTPSLSQLSQMSSLIQSPFTRHPIPPIDAVNHISDSNTPFTSRHNSPTRHLHVDIDDEQHSSLPRFLDLRFDDEKRDKQDTLSHSTHSSVYTSRGSRTHTHTRSRHRDNKSGNSGVLPMINAIDHRQETNRQAAHRDFPSNEAMHAIHPVTSDCLNKPQLDIPLIGPSIQPHQSPQQTRPFKTTLSAPITPTLFRTQSMPIDEMNQQPIQIENNPSLADSDRHSCCIEPPLLDDPAVLEEIGALPEHPLQPHEQLVLKNILIKKVLSGFDQDIVQSLFGSSSYSATTTYHSGSNQWNDSNSDKTQFPKSIQSDNASFSEDQQRHESDTTQVSKQHQGQQRYHEYNDVIEETSEKSDRSEERYKLGEGNLHIALFPESNPQQRRHSMDSASTLTSALTAPTTFDTTPAAQSSTQRIPCSPPQPIPTTTTTITTTTQFPKSHNSLDQTALFPHDFNTTASVHKSYHTVDSYANREKFTQHKLVQNTKHCSSQSGSSEHSDASGLSDTVGPSDATTAKETKTQGDSQRLPPSRRESKNSNSQIPTTLSLANLSGITGTEQRDGTENSRAVISHQHEHDNQRNDDIVHVIDAMDHNTTIIDTSDAINARDARTPIEHVENENHESSSTDTTDNDDNAAETELTPLLFSTQATISSATTPSPVSPPSRPPSTDSFDIHVTIIGDECNHSSSSSKFSRHNVGETLQFQSLIDRLLDLQTEAEIKIDIKTPQPDIHDVHFDSKPAASETQHQTIAQPAQQPTQQPHSLDSSIRPPSSSHIAILTSQTLDDIARLAIAPSRSASSSLLTSCQNFPSTSTAPYSTQTAPIFPIHSSSFASTQSQTPLTYTQDLHKNRAKRVIYTPSPSSQLQPPHQPATSSITAHSNPINILPLLQTSKSDQMHGANDDKAKSHPQSTKCLMDAPRSHQRKPFRSSRYSNRHCDLGGYKFDSPSWFHHNQATLSGKQKDLNGQVSHHNVNNNETRKNVNSPFNSASLPLQSAKISMPDEVHKSRSCHSMTDSITDDACRDQNFRRTPGNDQERSYFNFGLKKSLTNPIIGENDTQPKNTQQFHSPEQLQPLKQISRDDLDRDGDDVSYINRYQSQQYQQQQLRPYDPNAIFNTFIQQHSPPRPLYPPNITSRTTPFQCPETPYTPALTPYQHQHTPSKFTLTTQSSPVPHFFNPKTLQDHIQLFRLKIEVESPTRSDNNKHIDSVNNVGDANDIANPSDDKYTQSVQNTTRSENKVANQVTFEPMRPTSSQLDSSHDDLDEDQFYSTLHTPLHTPAPRQAHCFDYLDSIPLHQLQHTYHPLYSPHSSSPPSLPAPTRPTSNSLQSSNLTNLTNLFICPEEEELGDEEHLHRDTGGEANHPSTPVTHSTHTNTHIDENNRLDNIDESNLDDQGSSDGSDDSNEDLGEFYDEDDDDKDNDEDIQDNQTPDTPTFTLDIDQLDKNSPHHATSQPSSLHHSQQLQSELTQSAQHGSTPNVPVISTSPPTHTPRSFNPRPAQVSFEDIVQDGALQFPNHSSQSPQQRQRSNSTIPQPTSTSPSPSQSTTHTFSSPRLRNSPSSQQLTEQQHLESPGQLPLPSRQSVENAPIAGPQQPQDFSALTQLTDLTELSPGTAAATQFNVVAELTKTLAMGQLDQNIAFPLPDHNGVEFSNPTVISNPVPLTLSIPTASLDFPTTSSRTTTTSSTFFSNPSIDTVKQSLHVYQYLCENPIDHEPPTPGLQEITEVDTVGPSSSTRSKITPASALPASTSPTTANAPTPPPTHAPTSTQSPASQPLSDDGLRVDDSTSTGSNSEANSEPMPKSETPQSQQSQQSQLTQTTQKSKTQTPTPKVSTIAGGRSSDDDMHSKTLPHVHSHSFSYPHDHQDNHHPIPLVKPTLSNELIQQNRFAKSISSSENYVDSQIDSSSSRVFSHLSPTAAPLDLQGGAAVNTLLSNTTGMERTQHRPNSADPRDDALNLFHYAEPELPGDDEETTRVANLTNKEMDQRIEQTERTEKRDKSGQGVEKMPSFRKMHTISPTSSSDTKPPSSDASFEHIPSDPENPMYFEMDYAKLSKQHRSQHHDSRRYLNQPPNSNTNDLPARNLPASRSHGVTRFLESFSPSKLRTHISHPHSNIDINNRPSFPPEIPSTTSSFDGYIIVRTPTTPTTAHTSAQNQPHLPPQAQTDLTAPSIQSTDNTAHPTANPLNPVDVTTSNASEGHSNDVNVPVDRSTDQCPYDFTATSSNHFSQQTVQGSHENGLTCGSLHTKPHGYDDSSFVQSTPDFLQPRAELQTHSPSAHPQLSIPSSEHIPHPNSTHNASFNISNIDDTTTVNWNLAPTTHELHPHHLHSNATIASEVALDTDEQYSDSGSDKRRLDQQSGWRSQGTLKTSHTTHNSSRTTRTAPITVTANSEGPRTKSRKIRKIRYISTNNRSSMDHPLDHNHPHETAEQADFDKLDNPNIDAFDESSHLRSNGLQESHLSHIASNIASSASKTISKTITYFTDPTNKVSVPHSIDTMKPGEGGFAKQHSAPIVRESPYSIGSTFKKLRSDEYHIPLHNQPSYYVYTLYDSPSNGTGHISQPHPQTTTQTNRRVQIMRNREHNASNLLSMKKTTQKLISLDYLPESTPLNLSKALTAPRRIDTIDNPDVDDLFDELNPHGVEYLMFYEQGEENSSSSNMFEPIQTSSIEHMTVDSDDPSSQRYLHYQQLDSDRGSQQFQHYQSISDMASRDSSVFSHSLFPSHDPFLDSGSQISLPHPHDRYHNGLDFFDQNETAWDHYSPRKEHTNAHSQYDVHTETGEDDHWSVDWSKDFDNFSDNDFTDQEKQIHFEAENTDLARQSPHTGGKYHTKTQTPHHDDYYYHHPNRHHHRHPYQTDHHRHHHHYRRHDNSRHDPFEYEQLNGNGAYGVKSEFETAKASQPKSPLKHLESFSDVCSYIHDGHFDAYDNLVDPGDQNEDFHQHRKLMFESQNRLKQRNKRHHHRGSYQNVWSQNNTSESQYTSDETIQSSDFQQQYPSCPQVLTCSDFSQPNQLDNKATLKDKDKGKSTKTDLPPQGLLVLKRSSSSSARDSPPRVNPKTKTKTKTKTPVHPNRHLHHNQLQIEDTRPIESHHTHHVHQVYTKHQNRSTTIERRTAPQQILLSVKSSQEQPSTTSSTASTAQSAQLMTDYCVFECFEPLEVSKPKPHLPVELLPHSKPQLSVKPPAAAIDQSQQQQQTQTEPSSSHHFLEKKYETFIDEKGPIEDEKSRIDETTFQQHRQKHQQKQQLDPHLKTVLPLPAGLQNVRKPTTTTTTTTTSTTSTTTTSRTKRQTARPRSTASVPGWTRTTSTTQTDAGPENIDKYSQKATKSVKLKLSHHRHQEHQRSHDDDHYQRSESLNRHSDREQDPTSAEFSPATSAVLSDQYRGHLRSLQLQQQGPQGGVNRGPLQFPLQSLTFGQPHKPPKSLFIDHNEVVSKSKSFKADLEAERRAGYDQRNEQFTKTTPPAVLHPTPHTQYHQIMTEAEKQPMIASILALVAQQQQQLEQKPKQQGVLQQPQLRLSATTHPSSSSSSSSIIASKDRSIGENRDKTEVPPQPRRFSQTFPSESIVQPRQPASSSSKQYQLRTTQAQIPESFPRSSSSSSSVLIPPPSSQPRDNHPASHRNNNQVVSKQQHQPRKDQPTQTAPDAIGRKPSFGLYQVSNSPQSSAKSYLSSSSATEHAQISHPSNKFIHYLPLSHLHHEDHQVVDTERNILHREEAKHQPTLSSRNTSYHPTAPAPKSVEAEAHDIALKSIPSLHEIGLPPQGLQLKRSDKPTSSSTSDSDHVGKKSAKAARNVVFGRVISPPFQLHGQSGPILSIPKYPGMSTSSSSASLHRPGSTAIRPKRDNWTVEQKSSQPPQKHTVSSSNASYSSDSMTAQLSQIDQIHNLIEQKQKKLETDHERAFQLNPSTIETNIDFNEPVSSAQRTDPCKPLNFRASKLTTAPTNLTAPIQPQSSTQSLIPNIAHNTHVTLSTNNPIRALSASTPNEATLPQPQRLISGYIQAVPAQATSDHAKKKSKTTKYLETVQKPFNPVQITHTIPTGGQSTSVPPSSSTYEHSAASVDFPSIRSADSAHGQVPPSIATTHLPLTQPHHNIESSPSQPHRQAQIPTTRSTTLAQPYASAQFSSPPHRTSTLSVYDADIHRTASAHSSSPVSLIPQRDIQTSSSRQLSSSSLHSSQPQTQQQPQPQPQPRHKQQTQSFSASENALGPSMMQYFSTTIEPAYPSSPPPPLPAHLSSKQNLRLSQLSRQQHPPQHSAQSMAVQSPQYQYAQLQPPPSQPTLLENPASRVGTSTQHLASPQLRTSQPQVHSYISKPPPSQQSVQFEPSRPPQTRSTVLPQPPQQPGQPEQHMPPQPTNRKTSSRRWKKSISIPNPLDPSQPASSHHQPSKSSQ